MGVEPFLVSSSLLAVIGQRLARKLCKNCREAYVPTSIELENLGLDAFTFQGKTIYRAKGCHECQSTGYRGRTVIHELMIIDDDIRALIMQKSDASIIKKAAISKGMTTLRIDGINKVLEGITTPVELVSVTQE
jgi:type II secretory ATPase GspE/PulE/Tfp pilus assembly ATPase PilB-like protein